MGDSVTVVGNKVYMGVVLPRRQYLQQGGRRAKEFDDETELSSGGEEGKRRRIARERRDRYTQP